MCLLSSAAWSHRDVRHLPSVAHPVDLPGYQNVHDPEVRARFEAAWKLKLPTAKGLDNREMIDAIHAGKLKAMYIFGEEIALVDANANDVQDGLAKLEFFVAQDVFFSKTCQFADVIFPASPSLEKEGTFTSTERRIQRLYQVLEPRAWAQDGITGIRPRFTRRSLP